MGSRIDRVKKHFVDHKEIYITAAITATVSVGATLLVVQYVGIKPQINQKAIALWNSKITQHATQIVIDARGNSGNVIKDLTTGAIYPSQNAAAKALGVKSSNLSAHLNGRSPHVNGHMFEKMLDGAAPHVLTK